jgi:hypothetical protein
MKSSDHRPEVSPESGPRIIRFADLPEPEPIDTSEAIPDGQITWERILEEEPEVSEVLTNLGDVPNVRPYHRWQRYVRRHNTTTKAQLCKLVGWRARNPLLRSEAAYRMTMERMWELVL